MMRMVFIIAMMVINVELVILAQRAIIGRRNIINPVLLAIGLRNNYETMAR
jgi:hypothetical protein